jgi:hypothetical protein
MLRIRRFLQGAHEELCVFLSFEVENPLPSKAFDEQRSNGNALGNS